MLSAQITAQMKIAGGCSARHTIRPMARASCSVIVPAATIAAPDCMLLGAVSGDLSVPFCSAHSWCQEGAAVPYSARRALLLAAQIAAQMMIRQLARTSCLQVIDRAHSAREVPAFRSERGCSARCVAVQSTTPCSAKKAAQGRRRCFRRRQRQLRLGTAATRSAAACTEEQRRLAEAEQALVQFTLTFGPVHSFGGTVALSLSAWCARLTALWQGSALLGTTSAQRKALAMLAAF